MQEIYSNRDSSIVGLVDGILRESGIRTLLKNWTGSNITEIPIPSLYPTIHVLDDSQVEEARRIIADYFSCAPVELPEWECRVCHNTVDGYLSECWSCQAEK